MEIGRGVCVVLALVRVQSMWLADGGETMASLVGWNNFSMSCPHFGDADWRRWRVCGVSVRARSRALFWSMFRLGGLRRRHLAEWTTTVHVLVLMLLLLSAKHKQVRLRREASEIRPPRLCLDILGLIFQSSSLHSSLGQQSVFSSMSPTSSGSCQ